MYQPKIQGRPIPNRNLHFQAPDPIQICFSVGLQPFVYDLTYMYGSKYDNP